MKVLVASGIWPPDVGGPASHAPQIAQFLIERGHDVSAVVSAACALPDQGFPVRVTRRDRPLSLRIPAGAAALVGAVRKVDVVYATGMYHRVAVACRLARVPFVLKLVNDPAYERSRNWGRTVSTLEEFQYGGARDAIIRGLCVGRDHAVGSADALITPSEYLARIVRGWGLPPPVTVISNPAVVAASSHSRTELRRALGMNGPTAVFAGRLVQQKNLHLAIEAMRDVRGLQLMIIGEGPERAALKEAIVVAGVRDRVSLLPPVSQRQAGDWMRAADVTLLPSDWENFPHAAVESLAQGTPVIATAVGGVPEIVEHDRTGWLLQAGDGEALQRALLRVAQDEEAHRRLRAGASTVSNRYQPERLFALAEEVLRRALRTH